MCLWEHERRARQVAIGLYDAMMPWRLTVARRSAAPQALFADLTSINQYYREAGGRAYLDEGLKQVGLRWMVEGAVVRQALGGLPTRALLQCFCFAIYFGPWSHDMSSPLCGLQASAPVPALTVLTISTCPPLPPSFALTRRLPCFRRALHALCLKVWPDPATRPPVNKEVPNEEGVVALMEGLKGMRLQ